MGQDVQFANVDLEVESDQDLEPLVKSLGNDVNVQYHGRLDSGKDFASLSLRTVDSGFYGQPNQTLSTFCDLIEGLRDEFRTIWNQCDKREFDIGFESGDTDKTYESVVDNVTLRRVAELGATIEITIYPVAKD